MTAIRVNATSVGGKVVSASMQRLVSVDLETGHQTWEDDLRWESHIDKKGCCWFEYVGEQQVGAWSDTHGGNVGTGKYYSEKKLEDKKIDG